jgi:hypothetical protein
MKEVGYFPGFLDSDGRPWLTLTKNIEAYENMIKFALKVAMLTQKNLPIPEGYFLDNPIFQRIILNYSGNNKEAESFRRLMNELVLVMVNENSDLVGNSLNEWQEVVQLWIKGKSSQRNQQVYLNCLSHEDAVRLQNLKSRNQFQTQMNLALINLWNVDYPSFLNTLNSMKLKVRGRSKFNFDPIFRSKLVFGDEVFDSISNEIRDKLYAVSEATEKNGFRIARSLLHNPQMSLEMGLKEGEIITRKEYDKISKVLAHYHHYAFAESMGLSSFISFNNPLILDRENMDLDQRLSILIEKIVNNHNSKSINIPLNTISFQDIYKVRLGQKSAVRFNENLNRLVDAIKGRNDYSFEQAMSIHIKHIYKTLLLNHQIENPKELSKSIDEITHTGDVAVGTSAYAIRNILNVLKDFVPNVNKSNKIRLTLRQLA